MSSNRITPNQREVIAARDSITGFTVYPTATNNKLDVNASLTPSGTQDVNIIQVAGSPVAQGHGTAATAIRVELPTDGTGLVSSAQSGTWNITNISGTVSLPTGAATVAKQPALGTAGSASTDVITIQGIASMTPLVTSNTTTSVTGNGAAATAQRVTLANDSTGIIATVGAVTAITNALPTGTNSIGKISDITTSIVPGTGATNLGKAEDAAHVSGDTGVAVLAVRDDTLNSTSGTEGDYELLHTTATGALWVTQAPSTSNGWSTFMASSGDGSTALTNTAQQIKGGAGTLGGWYIYNPNSTATYVIIYNVVSASVTVGTTNPQNVLCIPPTAAANVEFGNGINFTTAMSVAATTTGGGNGAPAIALEANFYYA